MAAKTTKPIKPSAAQINPYLIGVRIKLLRMLAKVPEMMSKSVRC